MNKDEKKCPTKITIVTLHLKRKYHTSRFLKSLFSNTNHQLEVIVVSQESDNETVDFIQKIVKKYNDIKVIWNEKNVGCSKGRNQGIKEATGDYIAVIDNDVELTNNWLKPLIETLDSNQIIAAAASLVMTPQKKVQYSSKHVIERRKDRYHEIGLRYEIQGQNTDHELDIQCNVPWYPTTCMLLRASYLRKIQGFDEKYLLCEEDKDVCMSLRKSGYLICYDSRSKVIHHSYPRESEYAKVRENLVQINLDRNYFERKWTCKVIHEMTREYLLQSGYSEEQINRFSRIPFFSRVVG